METRQITQVRVYKLILHKKGSYSTDCVVKALSTEYDKLADFYKSQIVEDISGSIEFKLSSPLNGYDTIETLELNHGDHSIRDDWMDMETWEYFKTNPRFIIIE